MLCTAPFWGCLVDEAVAVFPALRCTKEFLEELPMECEGRRKVLSEGLGAAFLETFQQAPFLSLSMSKQFSEGVNAPGTSH